MTAPKTAKAPAGLSAPTRAWRAAVLRDYDLTPTQTALLDEACSSLDRARGARAVLDKHGVSFLDRWGQPRPRPEASVELAARGSFARLCAQLEVDADPPAPPTTKGT